MTSVVLPYLLKPIADDLAHEDVTDLVFNEPGRVGVKKSGKWEFRDVPELTFERMDAASIAIGRLMRKEFDEAHPYLNATLPWGHRYQGVRPPGTKANSMLWAIRRPPSVPRKIDDDDFDDLFADTNPAVSRRKQSMGKLIEMYKAALISKQFRPWFKECRFCGMSFGFVGPTGSGKTDMLRRCIQVERPQTRTVTIETDDEFGSACTGNTGRLFFDETQVSAEEAVRIALRLIPTEIWYQEVRGAEAYPLLRAFQTGHDGGGTSWHGDEGREFEALAMMARKDPSGRDMKENALMEMIRNAIDVLVYCEGGERFSVPSVRFVAAQREGAEL